MPRHRLQNTTAPVAGNHGSPLGCFKHLDAWLDRSLRQDHGRRMRVLDVGGGTGEKTLRLRKKFGTVHTLDCVDVFAHPTCRMFDGEHLPYADRSQDVVFFSYSLHHAGDSALPLLQEATRVADQGAHIVVLEDLKADSMGMQRAEAVHPGCTPRQPCLFRGDREWRAIFHLLKLRTVERMTPPRGCARPIVRALYVLQHDSRLDGRILLRDANTSRFEAASGPTIDSTRTPRSGHDPRARPEDTQHTER